MDHGAGTPFADVFATLPEEDVELVVLNRTAPAQVSNLLELAFEEQSVDVSEETLDAGSADDVVLRRDGERVTASPLKAVMSSFLMVNGDLYRTGTSGVDRHEAPSVLTALDGVPFRLRGFPDSNKEKLLLILVSRYVERLALEAGTGRLDASFQRLSRLEDEYGTRRIYERLGATDLDVHVYGVGDAAIPPDVSATPHTGTSDAYRDSWFVVHDPAGADADPAALIAVQAEDNRWDGVWTYDAGRVDRIRSAIEEAF